eukprot:CAMPEP_0118959624 /NCGR_PEP_ID=MMETSP1169-20130426/63227_1 /TAXON_ID=36882 /ORGANISM="Pyramimonas obovata, Strain CCMP722" /LENGTH=80 /DNA_ID=CAMNT_0006907761 /DNA_START=700 /DNA_END=939 /DNA_ORIENTATION=-
MVAMNLAAFFFRERLAVFDWAVLGVEAGVRLGNPSSPFFARFPTMALRVEAEESASSAALRESPALAEAPRSQGPPAMLP